MPRNTQVKYESFITYKSKVMAKVKGLYNKQMDKPSNRQTVWAKTICPRSIDSGEIKLKRKRENAVTQYFLPFQQPLVPYQR